MSTIADFVKARTALFAISGQPGLRIEQRWNERIVARGWHREGAVGAEKYLQQYGNGLGEDKAAQLAETASRNGCTDMANRFWSEAYFIFTGKRERYPMAAELLKPTDALVVLPPAQRLSVAYGVWDDAAL